ncbi:serine/threonine protein kinase [Couchioplanes caeruleus]|uniref:serine/threonine-protein kinase n=1 Tax=Couchioplanes caeruleus TaxID=56438 RepID=UPI0020BDFF24|nr:serine/threonine-protein kinase [Couchioplanes caeruleus]UQU67332.1 serine/threonine protein kinase [Couchioplanes caeruleus]
MPTEPLRRGDPQTLGGYRLLGRLGQGGMGAVYLGQSADGRLVAVKAIRPELADEPEFRARFRSEVNRARAVPSFCTAPVLDADPEHVTPYLVVEYVDGPSLAEVVAQRGPLTGGDLHSVAIGVATALTAIHGAGVIHRDLKPRNVLFSLGTPKVIDFGIARTFDATSNHTRTDQMVGTVAYMAPERFDTDRPGVGPAADVFAWGVVVTYAGTGRTPFRADSPAATAARILTQPPDLGGLPAPLRDIVALTLAKDPADRPTAAELLELLLDTGSHSLAELAGRPELQKAARAARATRSGRGPAAGGRAAVRRRDPGGGSAVRRRRMVIAGAAAAAVVLAGAGAWAMTSGPGLDPTVAAPAPTPTTAAPTLGTGPVIIDRLDRAGQWSPSRDEVGTCAFTGGRLVVSTRDSRYNVCRGPKDKVAGDQSIAVTVALLKSGSCASIGFRRVAEETGYVASACGDKVTLSREGDDTSTPIGTARSTTLADGKEHRVQFVIRDDVATTMLDDAPALEARLTDRQLVTGWVELGLDAEGSDGAVAYRDAEIRTLPDTTSSPSAPTPAFTDVSRGDTDSIVKLLSFRPGGKTAVVVEPVVFMTNPGFCQAFGIAPGDKRCSYPWDIAASDAKITLPRAGDAGLALLDPDDPGRCMDGTGAATCTASAADFDDWLGDGEELVRLQTRNGVAVRLAQLHLPD